MVSTITIMRGSAPASPNRDPRSASCLPFPSLTVSVCLFLALCLNAGDSSSDALRRLAVRVPKTGAVDWRNRSALPSTESETMRRRWEEIRPPAASDGPPVRLTLSESVDQYWLVAELDGKVWMESWPRSANSTRDAYTRQLERAVLHAQSTPMLDLSISAPDQAGGGQMVVLELGAVQVMGGGPRIRLPLTRPMPRDPRGRLETLGNGKWRALLPGMECRVDTTGSGSATCSESSGGAVAGWIVPNRNYFEDNLGKFYSSAQDSRLGEIRAGVDGKLHVYVGGKETESTNGWGSMIATLDSNCGPAILASKPGGLLTAMEWVAGNGPKTVAQPLAVGTITAMWPAADRMSTIVISRQDGTGDYEASRVSLSCRQ